MKHKIVAMTMTIVMALTVIATMTMGNIGDTYETITVIGPWESESILEGAMKSALPSQIKVMGNNQIWIAAKAGEPGYILTYSFLDQEIQSVKMFEEAFKKAYPNEEIDISKVAIKITIPKDSPEIIAAIRNVFYQFRGTGTYIPANSQIHWFTPEEK